MISVIEEMSKKAKFGLGAVGATGAAEGIGAVGQKYFGKKAQGFADMSTKYKNKVKDINDKLTDDKPDSRISKFNLLQSKKVPRAKAEMYKDASNKAQEKSEDFKDIRPSQLVSKGINKLRKGYEKITDD